MNLITVFCLAGWSVSQAAAPRDWVEPATGHRVVRLTPDEGGTKLYFHQNAFTASGDRMVLNTDGRLSVAKLDALPEVSVSPLLEQQVGNVVVSPRQKMVYYSRDGAVFRTSLDTKETTRIVELPPAMRRSAGFSLNADDSLLAGSYVEPADAPDGKLPPRGNARGGRRSLEDTMNLKLPRRLFTIHTGTGEIRTVHKSTDWLNHVQFSPTDPGLIMFCHEGTWHKVDRIWTIRTDGSGLRKIHTRTMEREIAGHEFFSPDGNTVWYDLQTPRSVEFWLAGMNTATGSLTKYRLQRSEWSVHYNISPDGKLFAGDGGGPNSVAKPDNGQWIYLFRPEGDRLVAEKLVDLSKHDYDLEPNVNFTPDGKWIIFQANMTGTRHVYAVEVAKAR